MDRSPFRDDLDAALERNRRLEAEITELQTRLRTATTPLKKKDGRGLALGAAVVACALLVAAILAGRRAPSSTTTPAESSGGIAIAPMPPVEHAPRVAPVRPRVSGPQDSKSPKPCTCAPGDPLCSCL